MFTDTMPDGQIKIKERQLQFVSFKHIFMPFFSTRKSKSVCLLKCTYQCCTLKGDGLQWIRKSKSHCSQELDRDSFINVHVIICHKTYSTLVGNVG